MSDGLRVEDAKELIKENPERYQVMPLPDSAILGKQWKDGKIVFIGYPRSGFGVIDTEIEPAEQEIENQLEIEPAKGATFSLPTSRIGYIDLLSQHFGNMTVQRLAMPADDGQSFTIVAFESLPFVFIDMSLEKCFQKMVKFVVYDIFDLVKILENKSLRAEMKQVIQGDV